MRVAVNAPGVFHKYVFVKIKNINNHYLYIYVHKKYKECLHLFDSQISYTRLKISNKKDCGMI